MNEEFLKVERLGSLSLVDVFAEYDHPLLFVCEDKYEALYLIVEIRDDFCKTEWIASRISENQYHDIVGERKSFESVFRENADEFIFLVSDVHDNGLLKCETISELPHISTFEGDTLVSALGYFPKSFQSSTDSIIEFEAFPNEVVDSVSIGMTKAICDSVNGIVKNKYGSGYYVKFAIPRCASFCFRFVVMNEDDTLPFLDNDKIAREVVSLVTPNSSLVECESFKTIENVNKLYKTLRENNASVIVNAIQGRKRTTISQAISFDEVKRTEKNLSEFIFKHKESKKEIVSFQIVSGTLYAYDIKNKKFSIKKDNDFISGSFSKTFDIEKKSVGLNCDYRAKIRTSDFGDVELLELTPIDEEQMRLSF